MRTLTIQIPEEILLCLNESEEELENYARTILAISLYQKHHISLGYGATIAGMNEEDFIYELGRAGVSIFHFDSKEEFLRELSNA